MAMEIPTNLIFKVLTWKNNFLTVSSDFIQIAYINLLWDDNYQNVLKNTRKWYFQGKY